MIEWILNLLSPIEPWVVRLATNLIFFGERFAKVPYKEGGLQLTPQRQVRGLGGYKGLDLRIICEPSGSISVTTVYGQQKLNWRERRLLLKAVRTWEMMTQITDGVAQATAPGALESEAR